MTGPLFVDIRGRFRTGLRSAFVRKVAHLLGFTAAGQVLTVLVSPILSRFFSPGDFGGFGIFAMFAYSLSGLTCLNYDAAVAAPPADEEAAFMAFGAAVAAFFVCAALSGVYAFFVTMDFFGYGTLPLWSALAMYALLLFMSFTSVLQYWCIRRQSLGMVGRGVILMNASRAAVQVGAGVIGVGWKGLVFGEIVGRIANSIYLWRVVAPDLLCFLRWSSLGEMFAPLVFYRRVALVLLPAMAIDALVNAFMVPFVNALFGAAAAGQYFMMRRVFDAPANLVGRSVADTFYGKISEYAREQPAKIRPFVTEIFAYIAFGAMVAFLPIMLFGPSIFVFVFGSEWKVSGLFAAYMAPAIAVSLGAVSVTRVFYLSRRPYLRYVFSLLLLAGMLIVAAITKVLMLPVTMTVAAVALVTLLAYVAYFVTGYIAAGDLDAVHPPPKVS